ncbi:hypothetical protein SAMN06269185_3319 [Natronoarchaeum philippinense]|uniref:Uncharacterized protein n=1 Tax=Natronoarchaeum philippinense TaxID=558529 RepID=A0A285P981_NATPI|nr:hypothetical protein [Natronoarchaeum philippinense]SNZ18282.1 hypothetical protein SAMN06269185_3319 [Natronoarchaeum philippinense]
MAAEIELGPAPTSENVIDLGLHEAFARLEELVSEAFDAALDDACPPDATSELALAHVTIRPFADHRKARTDWLAGTIRRRVANCDAHLHDAEAELGGWDGQLRDARQLCWCIAEALPDGRMEGRGRISRCARCLGVNINSTPNTLPCPGCEQRDRGGQS